MFPLIQKVFLCTGSTHTQLQILIYLSKKYKQQKFSASSISAGNLHFYLKVGSTFLFLYKNSAIIKPHNLPTWSKKKLMYMHTWAIWELLADNCEGTFGSPFRVSDFWITDFNTASKPSLRMTLDARSLLWLLQVISKTNHTNLLWQKVPQEYIYSYLYFLKSGKLSQRPS